MAEPVGILIDGIAHLADAGAVTRHEETNNMVVFRQEVAPMTWCEEPTREGRIPRADDLLRGPLTLCHVCRAMAALIT